MYRLYGFGTQNTFKALYVLEELGIDYDFQFVDLFKGEQKQEDFLKLTPMGKVPLLQLDDDCIFESGAICRYAANQARSPLYPEDALQRAKADQWIDFFSIHLGKWLSTLFFENAIKEKAGMGKADPETCKEAHNFVLQQMAIVDDHLANNPYFSGESLSIADLFAFAYIEQVETFDFSWNDFPHVKVWFDKLDNRDSIKRARQKFE